MGHGVQHVVLFSFLREPTADEDAEFRARIRGWASAGGFSFRALRVGVDTSGRSRGYRYCLFTEFEDPEALAAYQAHPDHRAFVEWVSSIGGESLAFDYPLGPDTVVIG